MDKTFVPRAMPGVSGTIIGPAWCRKGQAPVDGYGGKHKKNALSLLLTASPEKAMQTSPPQIFLGNQAVLPSWVADLAETDAALLWRQRSS